MAKRKNGEGSWGTKTIHGNKYHYYRDLDGNYFYGKTTKEVKEKIEKSKEKVEIDTTESNDVTFYEYLSEHLKTRQLELSGSAYDVYTNILNGAISSHNISNCLMSELTENKLRKFIESLSKKYSRATIEKVYRVVKPALEYAVKHKQIEDNYLKYISIPSEEKVAVKKKDIPYIIESDLDKLYEESKKINGIDYNFGRYGTLAYGNNAKAIMLIAHTGMRISELLGLKWECVDLEKKTITIDKAVVQIKDYDNDKYILHEKQPKSRASNRVIPLSDIAIEMIQFFADQNPNHKPKDYVVLTSTKTQPSRRNVQKTLDCMLSRANCSIDHCGLHGLRHGFGAILLTNGVDIKIVSKLLGHASVSTTYDIYIDFTKDQVENAVMNALNKKVAN